MIFEDLALNERAADIADDLLDDPESANVEVHSLEGATVVDCGIHTPGGLFAARTVTEVCLADFGRVDLIPGRLGPRPCNLVTVEMDDPAIACLLSQYAGWKVAVGDFVAMGSGPMRALREEKKLEELYLKLEYAEKSEIAVGVFESSSLPDEDVVRYLCEATSVDPEDLILLVAPTTSLAGTLQVVARSVETCLHKLYTLGFDVRAIRAATGSAFLPPVARAKDDLVAIGRANDSILYGSEVFLWVEADDATIESVGSRIPACASKDYGRPFSSIYESHGRDFYAIDPLLFSPAVVVINNLSTGACHQFGQTDHEVLQASFYG